MARAIALGLEDRRLRREAVAGRPELLNHLNTVPTQQRALRLFWEQHQGAGGHHLARQLLETMGVRLDLQLYGRRELDAAQRWLDRVLGAAEVRLVVLERESGFRCVWKGPHTARFNLCLVLQHQHYGYIGRVEQLFRVSP